MRELIRICMRNLSIDQMNYFVRASKAISYILISFFSINENTRLPYMDDGYCTIKFNFSMYSFHICKWSFIKVD